MRTRNMKVSIEVIAQALSTRVLKVFQLELKNFLYKIIQQCIIKKSTLSIKMTLSKKKYFSQHLHLKIMSLFL